MKRKNCKFSLLICVLMITSASLLGQTDVYEFPIKPGTKKWNETKSNAAKKSALQIPDEKIKNISTAGLIKTALDYPFFMEIMFYDNFQKGFEQVANNFNGLSELLKRKDAAKCLKNEYEELSETKFSEKADLAGKGRHSFKIMYLELILSQDVIISSLNDESARELVSNSLEKYKTKQKNSQIYGNESMNVNLILIGKVLEKKHNSFNKKMLNEKHISKVLQFEESLNENSHKEIINSATEFINN